MSRQAAHRVQSSESSTRRWHSGVNIVFYTHHSGASDFYRPTGATARTRAGILRQSCSCRSDFGYQTQDQGQKGSGPRPTCTGQWSSPQTWHDNGAGGWYSSTMGTLMKSFPNRAPCQQRPHRPASGVHAPGWPSGWSLSAGEPQPMSGHTGSRPLISAA